MNDVTQAPSQEQRRFSRDLRILADDAEALLRHAVQDTSQEYAEARGRLERSVARAKAQLDCADHAVRARARQAGAAMDDYVHQKPWPSLLAAAGLGFLAGAMLTRR